MTPAPAHPRRIHRSIRRSATTLSAVAIGIVLILTCSPTTLPADAATRRITAGDGKTVATGSLGTMTNGTARAAVTIPRKRAATVTVGLEMRRQARGDRYRVRATVTKSGKLRVAVVRYRGKKAKVLSQRRLATRVKGGQTLWLEGSVSGSKPVTVRARVWVNGKAKPGWQRTVNDRSSKRVIASGPVRLVVGLARTAGKKKVTVAVRSAAVMPSKPSAATTGVPAGTRLRVHNGDIVVTRAGTRLDRMDIRGFVVIKAPNVTISRSIVRGGRNPKTAQGVITNYGYKNLMITDTDVRTSYPSVYLDGIKGWSFTARRVHVVGGVDSVKIHGDNVTITESLLENTKWYAHDPYQDGGPTHNDNVQILKGRNITLAGNTIRGAQNFAVLGAANLGHVPNLVVRSNWLDGGHCTMKLQTMRGYKLRATVIGNRFGPHRRVSYCPIQSLSGVALTARSNVSELTGAAVQVWRKQ